MPITRSGRLKTRSNGGRNKSRPSRNRATSRSLLRSRPVMSSSGASGLVGSARGRVRSGQHGRDAINRVPGREWLGDVVVGAEREPLLALDVAPARGEHDDAHVMPVRVGADTLADGKAI